MNKDYKALGLAREDLVRMYRTMTLIREFEENTGDKNYAKRKSFKDKLKGLF